MWGVSNLSLSDFNKSPLRNGTPLAPSPLDRSSTMVVSPASKSVALLCIISPVIVLTTTAMVSSLLRSTRNIKPSAFAIRYRRAVASSFHVCADGTTKEDRLHPKTFRRRFASTLLRGMSSANIHHETYPRRRMPSDSFVKNITDFLDKDGIPWRHFNSSELRPVLQLYSNRTRQVDEWLALMQTRTLLAVGNGFGNNTRSPSAYSFLLNICPMPNLSEIQRLHETIRTTSNSSQAVASYGWLNSHLTNAFLEYNPSSDDKESFKPTTIVHLHQDVWTRSPEIVQSRLRSKCGHGSDSTRNNIPGRIFARQTVVRRITKSEYIPFLEENHLWGSTGAKYGYGLYLKPKKNQHSQEEVLVGVVTFSAKRRVQRGSQEFHSYELLRFCTKMDTTIVGGLTKLISAFVKDVPGEKLKEREIGIDIITSIDRDFGSNTWPRFDRMEVMNPVPMFVGEVDGIRRHAVGAGLFPLDQHSNEMVESKILSTSSALRVGLPETLLDQLNQSTSNSNDSSCWTWQLVAQAGFVPVFDAGVERLMHIVDSRRKSECENVSNSLSTSDLWEQSVPRYVTEHYSPNMGVGKMLLCMREKL